ncbi:secreted Ly-6/uPAR-related protein 1-like [Pseudophryne corroboree]|uniref:secreted Ly-6/uPAR-related protein 1-like n=1 Tax=Pseudophryne corroboree TaxID=495146 RepID=UPI003081E429
MQISSSLQRSNMMRFILCFLLALVCVELVCSLECYVCLTPTPSDDCTVSKNCSQQQKWCRSEVYGPISTGFPFTDSKYVVRNCAEKCEPTNPNSLGIVHPVYCCQENRCLPLIATNGAKRIHSSQWALAAVAGYAITALRAAL